MNNLCKMLQSVYNWHDKHILIIEDDYANYLLFHEILTCAHACLIRAVSLQEAFDMLNSNTRFDLVIMNNSIPGNEYCRSLKRIKILWPHVRILAIAGNDCDVRLNSCQTTGCDTLISKGIDSFELRTVVNEMLDPVN